MVADPKVSLHVSQFLPRCYCIDNTTVCRLCSISYINLDTITWKARRLWLRRVCFLDRLYYTRPVSTLLDCTPVRCSHKRENTQAGAAHARHRKVMNPAFSNPQLRSFLPMFQNSAKKASQCLCTMYIELTLYSILAVRPIGTWSISGTSCIARRKRRCRK